MRWLIVVALVCGGCVLSAGEKADAAKAKQEEANRVTAVQFATDVLKMRVDALSILTERMEPRLLPSGVMPLAGSGFVRMPGAVSAFIALNGIKAERGGISARAEVLNGSSFMMGAVRIALKGDGDEVMFLVGDVQPGTSQTVDVFVPNVKENAESVGVRVADFTYRYRRL